MRINQLVLLTKIFVPAFLFLAITAGLAWLNDIHFSFLTRDPITLLEGKPYIGLISNTGIIFWCATSAILLFSSKISAIQKKPRSQIFFLLFSGLLTLLLLIDDLFMMHDVIFPEYLNLGDGVFYSFYGILLVALLAFYRRFIMSTDYILLILAIIFFGGSAVIDSVLVIRSKFDYPYSFEDSLKFFGIIAWFAYFTRTSYRAVQPIG
jgi:hypothetical protein